jgi:hypothetical protein
MAFSARSSRADVAREVDGEDSSVGRRETTEGLSEMEVSVSVSISIRSPSAVPAVVVRLRIMLCAKRFNSLRLRADFRHSGMGGSKRLTKLAPDV